MQKTKTIIIIILSLVIFILLIIQFTANRYDSEKKLLDGYGIYERTAYEEITNFCNSAGNLDHSVCSELLIQTVIPYQEEYGDGYIFIFSNTRNVHEYSVVMSVAVLKDSTVKNIKREDPKILSNLTQTLRP